MTFEHFFFPVREENFQFVTCEQHREKWKPHHTLHCVTCEYEKLHFNLFLLGAVRELDPEIRASIVNKASCYFYDGTSNSFVARRVYNDWFTVSLTSTFINYLDSIAMEKLKPKIVWFLRVWYAMLQKKKSITYFRYQLFFIFSKFVCQSEVLKKSIQQTMALVLSIFSGYLFFVCSNFSVAQNNILARPKGKKL